MRQAGEPSVEEILESIKKVIARDNRAGAAEERREREERGLPGEIAAEPRAAAPEDVLDLAGMGEYIEADEAEEDAAYLAKAEAEASAKADDDPLVGTETVSSISESLAALAMLAQPPAAPQIVRSGETSLEGMVRDLLRPELAAWLDKNLPALVEKLVAAEIARIVGKKG
jgi:cell pole-organizing protein PopZ